MQTSDVDQGILLLTAHFSRAHPDAPKPLTPTEYGRFAEWLHQEGKTPGDLITDLEAATASWTDPKGKVTRDRLHYLVGRGAALGLALEKWNSAGIWVLTRANREAYPTRLRDILRAQAPAAFFGVGNRDLLSRGGLAMVGSRSIDEADRTYTSQVASDAAREGLNLVSGGAAGVDETAMLAALEVGGTAVGVLAKGLLSAALSGKWRRSLRAKDLCLISPFHPEASFNAGNAMGRNKYVYCLADYGLVVRCDEGKGGTWSGAREALKKRLAPVFVNPTNHASGNQALLKLGAQTLEYSPAENGGGRSGLCDALAKGVGQPISSRRESSPGGSGSSAAHPDTPEAQECVERMDTDSSSQGDGSSQVQAPDAGSTTSPGKQGHLFEGNEGS